MIGKRKPVEIKTEEGEEPRKLVETVRGQKGIVCRRCESRLSVVLDTRYSHIGKRRRRQCTHCGLIFSTTEVII